MATDAASPRNERRAPWLGLITGEGRWRAEERWRGRRKGDEGENTTDGEQSAKNLLRTITGESNSASFSIGLGLFFSVREKEGERAVLQACVAPREGKGDRAPEK